ncbi:hypothetical protein V6N11_047281 [Hibiscus sabdariffa]|uniref:Uncharacterized protein n=2 Tax=Hibiscus sabdariffa TaxID=183260 RepID=A0ABR2BE90_9ROSI
MATVSESPEDSPNPSPPLSPPTPPPLPSGFPSITESSFTQQVTPWLDHVVEQSVLYKKIIDENINATIEASRSRLTEIQSASSAHFNQTIDSLKDAKSQLGVFEAMTFHKVKGLFHQRIQSMHILFVSGRTDFQFQRITIAASNPLLTGGAAIGLGFLLTCWRMTPRAKTSTILQDFASFSEPRGNISIVLFSLISKADTRVKELRQSIDRLKAESEKLERSASVAEEELIRGRTKLRQAGKQIRSLIQSAYKIERQAAGLKDTLGGLPSREASQFRSQVSSLASQAKRERRFQKLVIMELQFEEIPLPF